MKKILTITFAFVAFAAFATGADAQTRNGNQRANQQKLAKAKHNQDVRTYLETRIVKKRGQQFRETYQVKVFPNGRTVSKLISSVKVRSNRGHRSESQSRYENKSRRW